MNFYCISSTIRRIIFCPTNHIGSSNIFPRCNICIWRKEANIYTSARQMVVGILILGEYWKVDKYSSGFRCLCCCLYNAASVSPSLSFLALYPFISVFVVDVVRSLQGLATLKIIMSPIKMFDEPAKLRNTGKWLFTF